MKSKINKSEIAGAVVLMPVTKTGALESSIAISPDGNMAIITSEGILNFTCPISDAGESYRVLNHWRASGIIAEKINSRLTITELIWIRIIQELRTFGLSLEAIKKVHGDIYCSRNENSPYPKIAELVNELWDGNNYHLSIQKDGHLTVIPENRVSSFIKSPNYKNSLLLSFKNLISEGLSIMDKIVIDRIHEAGGALTQEELVTLQVLREKKYKKVIITMKNGSVELIEAVDTINVDQRLKHVFDEQKYCNIEVIQANGKVVAITRTTKIKPQK